MWEEIKNLLLIVVPIVTTLIGVGIQRWWLAYKTKKFKLIDHPIFTDLTLSIRDLKGWHPAKNRQVFTDSLIIKLEHWIKEGKDLACELQKGNYSNLQLKNRILTWAANVIESYTSNWRENGVPEKVIERITEVHEEKVQQFLTEIKAICYANDMYPFKMQKSIAVFDTLRLLLADTKNDFNRLVYRERYNGHFTGTEYKGIPINDEEYNKQLIKLKNK